MPIADMEYDRELAEQAVKRIRTAGAEGLSLDELAAGLRAEGWRFSDRRLQELLKRLEEEGRIARRPARGGRGRPRLRYVPPEASLGPLFGEAALRLVPKDRLEDYRRVAIPPEELERLREEYGWIATTALDHILQEDVAQALREAALELAEEDPRELLLDMARWTVERLRAARRELLAAPRGRSGEAEERINQLEEWARFARRFFGEVVGLPFPLYEGDEGWAMRIEMDRRRWRDPEIPDEELFALSEERAREELARRVLGRSVVEIEALGGPPVEAFAATDASVADLTIKILGRGAMEQPEEVQIFSSAAALQILPKGWRPPPMLDFDIDPDIFRRMDELEAFRQGLAIFPAAADWMGLSEGRMSHARSAALDLRQYRRDVDVMSGRVHWRRARMIRSLDLRVPQILFRDGRLLPSDHQIGLYEDRTPYGDLVRNQIRAAAHAVHAARLQGCAYIGVVKEPEIHFLAPLAFWHAAARRRDPRVDEKWILRPRMGDPFVAFVLLSAAAQSRGAAGGRLALSFRLLRRFSDIAELRGFYLEEEEGRRRVRLDRPEDWRRYFDQYVERQDRRYRDGDTMVPPLPRDEYNAFAELCQRMAVLQLFVLRVGEASRPVLLPRYEAMVDAADPAWPVENQWRRTLELLRAWAADPEAFELDEEHDPSLRRPDREAMAIPRLLPRVIVEAHRAAGGAAEELRTETGSRLQKAMQEIARILQRRRGGG